MKKDTNYIAVFLAGIIFALLLAGPQQAEAFGGTRAVSAASGTVSSDTISSDTISSDATILMVGDVLLHTRVSDSGRYPDGKWNYDHLFANVSEDIAGADLAMVNQEVILGGRDLGLSGYPAFNGAYEVGDAEAKAGFDLILHGTNHALDKGKKGIVSCLKFWHTSHPEIGVAGINDSQKAQDTVYVTEKHGIRIAVLNYTYATNGIRTPAGMPYAVNYLEKERVNADLKKAGSLADFTVVCPHWGTEDSHTISESQKKWTKIFSDGGADLVIGTHPHVIQPVQWYTGDDGHRMLVFYSLGNFINYTSGTGSKDTDRMCGEMAEVTVAKDAGGNAYIADYSAVPLVTQAAEGTGKITTYRFSDYTPELASKNRIISQDSAFSYEACRKIFDEYIR